MKQTQTKLFDFSDVGLDFCMGSKNLFPDRFKKMLTLGYNVQTVVSISGSGNQVTFTYGGAHGYVANRVLKIDSGDFTAINGGEFWIDSVTTNTVTMTIEDAPLAAASGFTTRIASLGWSLEYEQPYIHIYKMKHIDDTDRYVRFCFQSNVNDRNAVAVCIGKTFDANIGVINDQLALQSTASITNASLMSIPKWDSYRTMESESDFTYSQGFSRFGLGMVTGSIYHFAFIAGDGYELVAHHIYGVLPCHCLDYDALDYPVLVGLMSSDAEIYGNFSTVGSGSGHASIGNIRVRFDFASNASNPGLLSSDINAQPKSSFLTERIDSFNTTTAKPLEIYEQGTSQYLGQLYGLYLCMYSPTNMPVASNKTYPLLTTDIELDSLIMIAASGSNNIDSSTSLRFLALPIEEIKIV